MAKQLAFLLVLLTAFWISRSLDMKRINVVTVTGLEGGNASLSCDVAHPSGDAIVLLLWFREGKTTPIYRYDARSSSTSSRHWAEESLAGRASMDVSLDQARLLVRNLARGDIGFYRCRVDFLKQPTKTTRVSLSVVVPPTSVRVYEGENVKPVSTSVGPFKESDTITLTCVVSGGIPRPHVVWYEDTRLLDGQMESETQNDLEIESASLNSTLVEDDLSNSGSPGKGTAPSATASPSEIHGDPYNTLVLGPLTRNHLKMLLTCEASNNNLTLPTSQVVMVDMNLAPLGMSIKGPEQPVVASKSYTFECMVYGARPPPRIIWWKEQKELPQKTPVTISPNGNVTTRALNFVPMPSDDGSTLRCKAEAEVTSTVLEKEIQLRVHYAPKAKARFGASLDSGNIKEDDDVYFECIIDANPKAIRVSWRQNNELLIHNITAGVIVSNQSLVLQGVKRQQAGLYTCHAFNILGDGSSNAQRLDVKYAPVCAPNQVITYAVSRHEDAEVTCSVDANPSQSTFQWTFNNTADTIDVPNGRFTVSNSHSVITYTPVTSLDYGTLLCWASNRIGTQKEPCLFHIVPAGKPESANNCTLNSRHQTVATILCQSGSGGGFDQVFHLHVSQNGLSVFNVTQDEPYFKVDHLRSGVKYRFTITAENERGSSFPTFLEGYTKSANGPFYKGAYIYSVSNSDGPSEAEVREGSKNGNSFIPPNSSSPSSSSSTALLEPLNVNSFLPIAFGIGSGLVLIIIILVILITMRLKFRRGVAHRSNSQHKMLKASSEPSLARTPLDDKLEDDLFDSHSCVNHKSGEGEADLEPDVIRTHEEERFFQTPFQAPSSGSTTPLALLAPEAYSYPSSFELTASVSKAQHFPFENSKYLELSFPATSCRVCCSRNPNRLCCDPRGFEPLPSHLEEILSRGINNHHYCQHSRTHGNPGTLPAALSHLHESSMPPFPEEGPEVVGAGQVGPLALNCEDRPLKEPKIESSV